ncbi:MAG: gluconolaconase [Bryobacterales bacterium]|nr:gluconolaconase [Bryobacterales bacterium]
MALENQGKGPAIDRVSPAAAIAGGEFQVRGDGLFPGERPEVRFGDVSAPIIVGSEHYLMVRVPETATVGELVVSAGEAKPVRYSCGIGIQIADSLHPVGNPAIDGFGNIYTTFSGSRGQKTPVSVYKIDHAYETKPFVSDLMNATGLAFDSQDTLYVSSRFDGVIYKVAPNGSMTNWVEGMGVATGMAFDASGNLYVGDRSGTIFKIGPDRNIYVYATIEPSVSAYHLAFNDGGELFVTGPTTSSYDTVYRVNLEGEVSPFYRGLGRPQGLAFSAEGDLYVAGSLKGRKGIVKITPDAEAELFVSGPNIVGLAFAPSRAMIVATTNAIYRVDVDIRGRLIG